MYFVVSGCGSAIGQGPVHREYLEINKMINETMGSKNIYSSNKNIRVSCLINMSKINPINKLIVASYA